MFYFFNHLFIMGYFFVYNKCSVQKRGMKILHTPENPLK